MVTYFSSHLVKPRVDFRNQLLEQNKKLMIEVPKWRVLKLLNGIQFLLIFLLWQAQGRNAGLRTRLMRET